MMIHEDFSVNGWLKLYFLFQQKEQLNQLRDGLHDEISFHEEQIKRHQEAIARHKNRIGNMDKK